MSQRYAMQPIYFATVSDAASRSPVKKNGKEKWSETLPMDLAYLKHEISALIPFSPDIIELIYKMKKPSGHVDLATDTSG